MSSRSNSTFYSQEDIRVRDDHFVVCLKFKHVNSNGIWVGHNTLEFVLPVMMLQVFLAFFVSRAVYFVLRPSKQPKFVCYVLGGILLGPSVLGQSQVIREKLFPPIEMFVLNMMATVGTLYFVFLIAVKMDISMILRTARKAWSVGLAGLMLPFLTLLFFIYSNLKRLPGVKHTLFPFLFASCLSVSFFPVVAFALEELNLITSELGQLALSSAIVNEVILWSFLSLYMIFNETRLFQAIGTPVAFFTLVFFTLFVVRPAIVGMARKITEARAVHEVYDVLILVGVLVMAFITDMLGTSIIYGALLLGFIVPDGAPLGSILVEKTELFVSEFFMPLFFVLVGYEIDISAIKNWKAFATLQGIIFVGYFAKFVGVVLTSLSFKIRPKHTLFLGLILNTRGVVELIYSNRWKVGKLLDEQSYAAIVLSTLAIIAVVTPLADSLYNNPQVRGDSPDNRHCFRAIQTTPPASEFRVISCIHNEENVNSIINLLEASNPTEVSPICAYVIHLLELVGRAAPLLIHYHKHNRFMRLTTSFCSSDHILRAFVNYSKNASGPVTLHPFTMIAPYKSMHENICRIARDKQIPLIIIPYHNNQRAIQGDRVATSVRGLNATIKTLAPCTVGVLVDRGFRNMRPTHFSYHVGVVFIGGRDDREALAYASRMSGHPDVSVTVIRVILRDQNEQGDGDEDEKMERLVDEALFDEFKLKNICNACVVCREIMVEDSVGVVDAIRSLERNYDLAMVGRRHRKIPLHDEEMPAFTVNEDLGVIGDVLASSDSFGVWVSVLVLHCEDVR